MPKENNDKFTPDEDGEHKAYYGWVAEGYDADDDCFYIVTPYFKHKLNCEDYTGTLCDANGIKYRYERNIRAKYGKWTRANGEEIDEANVPVGERFEKR